MPIAFWRRDPITVLQGFESRRQGRGSTGALILWAVWATESLYYLDDLDSTYSTKSGQQITHHPHVIDIAHVRWGTSTSITALDLCAAALGRDCCNWTKATEPDLRDFDSSSRKKGASALRGTLPPVATNWIDAVLADNRYKEIQGARNPLIHSRLIRNLSMGDPRTTFVITDTGNKYAARDLVTLAKDLATDKVSDFLDVVNIL
jgi:hypothetical protein